MYDFIDCFIVFKKNLGCKDKDTFYFNKKKAFKKTAQNQPISLNCSLPCVISVWSTIVYHALYVRTFVYNFENF